MAESIGMEFPGVLFTGLWTEKKSAFIAKHRFVDHRLG
jgi:hypothetical protein